MKRKKQLEMQLLEISNSFNALQVTTVYDETENQIKEMMVFPSFSMVHECICIGM